MVTLGGPVAVARDVVVRAPDRVILDGASLSLAEGEVVSLMGPSGSGKTTLLHCLAGLRRVDGGEVWVLGTRLDQSHERAAAALRQRGIGIVFQFGELLAELTVAENVGLPLLLRGQRGWATTAERGLDRVGLGGRGADRPAALSGGEVQRVGVARALVGEPALVLADEPTGSLDADTAVEIAELLVDTCRASGAALVLATHDESVAARADHQLALQRGRVVERLVPSA